MSTKSRASRTIIAVIATAVIALTCASCGSADFSEETKLRLDQLLNYIMEENNIPGAVAGIWASNGTWIRTKGKAVVQTGAPERTSYRFRIGSITKTFTATVILQLADEKKLSLDDKLEKYVKGFRYGDRITVRMLCNNTSGVFPYDDTPGFTETNITQPERQWSPQELVDLAKAGEPSFLPGTNWKYSNSNFVLLGVIAETVTGKDLSSEIDRRIVKPLGLTATFLPKAAEFRGAHSNGYVTWAGRWGMPSTEEFSDVTDMNPSWGWAAGAMISRLEDLRVWAKALATGKLLSKEMQKERLTWVDIPGGDSIEAQYGLGIYAMGGLIGHDGMIWGYNTAVFYYPPEDTTFVVLFNKGMDQKNGEWVSPDLPFILGASAVVLPGKMPWDQVRSPK